MANTGKLGAGDPPSDGSVWSDPLVVMALQQEGGGAFARAGIPVLYTGLGKVNAAIGLTRRLAEYRHAGQRLPVVVNFGTAGSRRYPTHTLVACDAFVQRDMDVSGLGFPVGTTPFEDVPARLEFPVRWPELPAGLCGSGDSFAIADAGTGFDVIDMEAYAYAKVCWLEGASFACVKYVTDGADHAAAADWQANTVRAADAFLRLYEALVA
jgi:adenosylhomocysteine nucleosidase